MRKGKKERKAGSEGWVDTEKESERGEGVREEERRRGEGKQNERQRHIERQTQTDTETETKTKVEWKLAVPPPTPKCFPGIATQVTGVVKEGQSWKDFLGFPDKTKACPSA